MRKLKWGVLGTAKIAREQVIPALQASENGEVVAIASRDLSRAEVAAGQLGIAKAHGSYDAMVADPEIEAVYIPLPNHLHLPWSMRALESGKHVLCEKPIAMNAAQAAELLQAARRQPELKVMEAFMYRFHPQWEFIRDLIAGGGLGDLTSIYSTFTYDNVNPRDFRNIPEYGGGGLLDIGCYSISSSRWLFGSEPKRVFGMLDYDPTFKIDRLASAILDFGGASAAFTCATQVPRHQRADIYGTSGWITIEAPFNPPFDGPARSQLHTPSETTEILSPVANQYTLMGDAFATAALAGTAVPTPLEDALANMRVIDAVIESGHTRSWVTV